MTEKKATPVVAAGDGAPLKAETLDKPKVVRRLVKSKVTKKAIRTDIVRIDANGEETLIASYPGDTPVPSTATLQASGRKLTLSSSSPSAKKEDSAEAKANTPRSDIGPSVPVNVPGLDDLLEKEKELMRAKLEAERKKIQESQTEEKKPEENLEAALISIAKRKRQKDPKSRRRGLAASTMPRRADSDDDEDKNEFAGDTDYRAMQTNADDDEDVKERKERHRRRRERKHREKPAAYKDKEANDSGIDGANDQRPYDPEDEEQELHPLEEAELLAKQLQASASLKQQKEAERLAETPAEEVPSPTEERPPMSDISDDALDEKPKKKKKKHKSKKKKKKKQKRKASDDESRSDKSDREERSRSRSPPSVDRHSKEGLTKDEIDKARRTRSRSNSFSSLTLSTISSDFSESFDFAEVTPMAVGPNNFRGGFRGRGGFNMPFQARGAFRGFPRGRPPRGGFRGGWAGFPAMDPMAAPMFMGRGAPGMWRGGPWGPMMGGGRGGFHNFEEGGIGIYVEDESDGSRRRSRSSRSYSSYSSYSSRSRSRSRRRHRRRRHSSSSYSSYSRSSRSYSRSYSRSSRSYSRSYSRSSRSYSSYSRSKSRSKSRSPSTSGRSRSPHFRDIYNQGAAPEPRKQEEEVPWWAEFDKTYELQKQAEKEAKLQAGGKQPEEDEGMDAQPVTQLEGTSYDFADMTTEDIDVVRTVMSLVDKSSRNQDADVEDARRCMAQLLDEVCAAPELQSPESAAKDCMNSILDQLCPDDPTTIAREKEKTDANIPQFPKVNDDENSKLLRWYTIACHVTKQTRAMRHQAEQEKSEDEKEDSRSEEERPKSAERRGRRGRRRRRRRRHRGRSYSRSSYSSSDSEKRPNLVDLTAEQQKSLQQAQQLLVLQQKQLQAAGILPKSLAIPNIIPNLLPTSTASVPEPEVLSQRWDKDMDALLKTKSKDDITRKLMQRMKEKKQLGDSEDFSPTFRNKTSDTLVAEKMFPGAGNLKSRKIAITSIDKSKYDDISYKKSDIAAAQASIEEATSKDNERLRELEQRGKLAAWSDEQKGLKEEVKRQMREEIEKAERAKKELLKEQMLEAEKQREIMRIREEVREQIKKEIRDEIAKQRQQVLEDPELKSQLMELEALRQSKIPKSEGAKKPYIKPLEESFVMVDQDKHKEDMNNWIEQQHGKRASDMSVDEMRKMQMIYMQQLHHWSQQQQKTYMQWYWHQQQHYKQHSGQYNQQSSYYGQNNASSEQDIPRSRDFPSHDQPQSSMDMDNSNRIHIIDQPTRGSTFTHAPSKGPHSAAGDATTHMMPPRGVMSSQTNDEQMHPVPRSNMQNRPQFPPHDQFNRRGMPGNFRPNNDMIPRRSMPGHTMNQPRYMQTDMNRHRRPFPEQRDPNQAPIHQYPGSDFERRNPDEYQPRMNVPVSGIPGQHMNQYERPPYDARGGPRFESLPRPRFDGPRHPGDQQGMRFNQRMQPPFDQQHSRPQFDPHMRPQFDQRMRQPFSAPNQAAPRMQNHGPDGPFNQQPMGQGSSPMVGQGGPPMVGQGGPPMVGQGGPPIVGQGGPVPGPPVGQQLPPVVEKEENVADKNTGNDQPPPPGVDANSSQPSPNVVAPPGVEELKPPGEETVAVPAEPEKVVIPKPSKKKKKKHRKHRKKRGHSSSSADDDAQHAEIVKQLEALQAVEEGEIAEVEEGEVQSDEDKKPSAIAAAAALLKQLKAREKKRHKKKKRRKRESSSEEEEKPAEAPAAQPIPEVIPPPPFFHEVVPPPVEPPPHVWPFAGSHEEVEGPPRHIPAVDNSNPPVHMQHPAHNEPPGKEMGEDGHFTTEYKNFSFTPHIQHPPERYHPPGAGEPHIGGPQHGSERNEHFTHYIGPGGDHTLGQERKRSPSPLPAVMPDNPRDMEMWARRMADKYLDEKTHQHLKPLMHIDSRKVEKIPSLLDKFIPAPPEQRRIASIGTAMRGSRREFHGRQHPDDDRMMGPGRRKGERIARGRGRKRKRGVPRNYHDWDQPADDGLIYYFSDSDNSSGWGSDKNFDDLLAKKKRESMQKPTEAEKMAPFSSPQPIHVTNTRRPSPRREPGRGWDRPDMMGEPQGIPVIGGAKPQPIPSLANRTGQLARNEYDIVGRPVGREEDLKIQQDYWMPNEQQMMPRNSLPWEQQSAAAGARAQARPAWPRPPLR